MKRFFGIIAACLLLTAVPALAEGLQQLTVNGQTVEKIVGRITFDGDNVVLHFQDGTDMTASMDAVVLAFQYTPTTVIGMLRQPVGRSLNIEGLDEGTIVSIYGAQGCLVVTTTAQQARTVLSTKAMKNGTYVLKAGNQLVKFIKR